MLEVIKGKDTDKTLIREVLQGKSNAFGELVLNYQPSLQAFCTRMLSSDSEGADACQEAFLKAFHSLSQYKEQTSFKAWLFKIARNHCIDQLRKRKVRNEQMLDEDTRASISVYGNTHSILEAKDLAQQVLLELPEDYRELILLREAYDMNYEEISEVTARSLDSVKSMLKRARKEALRVAEELTRADNHVQQAK